MDRCPQEIVSRIVSYVGTRLGEERVKPWQVNSLPLVRPNVAAISTRFQTAVESLTFREIRIDSTEVAALERIFEACPARARHLRRISLALVLPTYAASRYGQFETEADRATNNEAVTEELNKFFSLLAKWCSNEASLDLEIVDVYSPSDEKSHRGASEAGAIGHDEYAPGTFDRPDLEEGRYRFSLLNLITEGGSGLPPLPCVRKFTINNGSRPWHPEAVAQLTSKMTQAEALDWSINWNSSMLWGRYHSMDSLWRDALVRAVESSMQLRVPIVSPSVKEFRFAMVTPQAAENKSLPDFLHGSNGRDPVGLALQRLSRDCEKLVFEGAVHPSFFDTSPTSTDQSDQQAWGKLRELHVKFDTRGPHGRWYFGFPDGSAPDDEPPQAEISGQLPPGYGATEEELQDAEDYYDDNYAEHDDDEEQDSVQQRRSLPVDAEINTLLQSFARACARLPCLKLATLGAEYKNDEEWPFQIVCVAPGESMGDWDSKFASNATWRVYLHAEDWRPDQETMDVLEGAFDKGDGKETVVTFLPWGNFYE